MTTTRSHLLRILALLSAASCDSTILTGGGGGGGTPTGGGGTGNTCEGQGADGFAGAYSGTSVEPNGYPAADPPKSFQYCFSGVSICKPAAAPIDAIHSKLTSGLDCSPCGFCDVYSLSVESTCSDASGDCCFAGTVTLSGAGCVGRPFRVGDAPVLASLAIRADWSTPVDAAELPPETRARLARLWAEDASFEHASIASFARHVLELLAVGAPADLVRDALRALGDEVEHARLCFSLASRYGDAPMGPGALDVSGATSSPDLATAAACAARDGCVVETISARIAATARDAAADPVVRAALATIAEDEWRHAELGWRFVAWAVRTGGPAVRDAVARAFDEAAFEPTEGADGSALERAHGRLTTNQMRAVAAETLREIIEPARRALLGEAQPFFVSASPSACAVASTSDTAFA